MVSLGEPLFCLSWEYISVTLLDVSTLVSKIVLPNFSSTSSVRVNQLPCGHLVLSDCNSFITFCYKRLFSLLLVILTIFSFVYFPFV